MRNLSWPSLALVLLSAALPSTAQPNPAAPRDAIVAMANIGQCRGGAYLSNGKEVVFISNLSGSPQVWKVPATGAGPCSSRRFLTRSRPWCPPLNGTR
ncbi:hypothetical protein ACFQT0_30260 [Hymenobacter humi]|uniref:SMP-30/Gluconolactonase/LRE-like region domain-containing protein n=1 Tax=Hymenobacter humi TaxID=1411620 RepID=A0ABW2UG84_9BACT